MKKVLFLANHYLTLYSFRRELIEKLCREGCEVVLSIPADPENEYFRKLGCRIVETEVARRSLNPVKDIRLTLEYIRLLRREKPDVIFSYTIKPNAYGSIASRITGDRQICNITGTGETLRHSAFVRNVVHALYKVSIRHCEKVFFQNTSDRAYFIEHGLVREERTQMLPGSGVNLANFTPAPMPDDGETRFIYIGRVMGLKGIDQFIQAARIVREQRPDAKFFIAGFAEEGRYKELVEKSHAEGLIEYLGFRKDIGEWIKKCHCTILPSHGGEGVPNVLLESAATGRACIASRIPGSIDVVDEGKTGYLFTAGNAEELADRIFRFMSLSCEQKAQMGLAGREKVERCFNRDIVIRAYMDELDKIK
ncbi:MAG: glycosyltransferase family 4 protein [Clostridia bacterium]|nr:glycosyltransferase family 4 protein [Clostridia bacterium]MBQ4086009.1 glycosyltransferase family 4 protein [Clostridia bacterium]